MTLVRLLAETHALLLNRSGYDLATRFLRMMDTVSSLELLRADLPEEDRARQIIYRYRDKHFSFADATSFAIIEHYKIPYAISFDDDFLQYGIPTLPPRT